MNYRKKPVVIQAIAWTGANRAEIRAFMADPDRNWIYGFHGGVLRINTLEGLMEAVPGDYVIRGIKGEFYACKPDIFVATYEPVP